MFQDVPETPKVHILWGFTLYLVVIERTANPLFAGSIPARASIQTSLHYVLAAREGLLYIAILGLVYVICIRGKL